MSSSNQISDNLPVTLTRALLMHKSVWSSQFVLLHVIFVMLFGICQIDEKKKKKKKAPISLISKILRHAVTKMSIVSNQLCIIVHYKVNHTIYFLLHGNAVQYVQHLTLLSVFIRCYLLHYTLFSVCVKIMTTWHWWQRLSLQNLDTEYTNQA